MTPAGWSTCRSGDLLQFVTSGSRGWAQYYADDGPVFVRIGNLDHDTIALDMRDVQCVKPPSNAEGERTRLRGGDILVSITAELGMVGLVPDDFGEAYINQHIALARPRPGLDERYLAWFFAGPGKRQLLDMRRGMTKAGLGLDDIRGVEVLVPPVNEQRRIVAKLEALQARSRRAREALDAVPPLLEKLRQSILAAAFRGDLTKDWRAKHKDVEPASKVLERIRVERRKRWEEGELAKMKAKGKAPSDDKWKAKYEEPEAVDAMGLPELPEGWCWVPLPALGEVARGKSKHRPRNDPALFGDAVPFIQTGEVARSGGRITSRSAMYSPFGLAQSRVFPQGTVCITIAANIAATGILTFAACFPDSVVGFLADGGPVVASYVELFIRTARADLKRFAPATAQANINLEVLGEVAVPVPPRDEMTLLVNRVEQAMGRVSTAASHHGSVAEYLRTLDRAVLAKAFRGELVPQDPSDEPAEMMVTRLRAQNGAAGSEPRHGHGAPTRQQSARASGQETT